MTHQCFLRTPFISRTEGLPSYMWALFLILILKVYESGVFRKKATELGAELKCRNNIFCVQ